MIHTWGEDIEVYPRSAAMVEENGTFLSNYVCMQPVKKVQMYPTANLVGDRSVARFSSIVIASPTSYLDIGSRGILRGKGSSTELITRAITRGGTIISRGEILGETEGTKGHLECKGLILKDGTIHAIPEIKGTVVGTELTHEAAVGKLARDEIEYVMSRGLDEEEATATIIRGFLDVKISGLPDALQKQIDMAIDSADKSVGDAITIENNDHNVIIQSFAIKVAGVSFEGINCYWFCTETNRHIILTYVRPEGSLGQEGVREGLQRYLDAIVCH
jgi:Fe-S cluster assembly scaffold protein SufB